MKTIDDLKAILQQHRAQLRERFGVARLAVFGSYARGDQTPQSDVDVMVELEHPLGYEFVDLHDTIETMLGVRVDLATPAMLTGKPRLWKSVEEDLAYV